MKTRRLALPLLALPLLALLLLAAACGRLNDSGGGAGDPTGGLIAHPTGPNDLVLRWEYVGGFVSPETLLGRIPAFSLYGDGRLISEGPQIEIYPGPALPNLLVQTISEDGIQAILAAARDAGLTDGDATYPFPCVADVPDTRFTVTAGGTTSVVTATAVGGGGEGPCQGADTTARAKLSDFWSKLGSLATWLPEGSIGTEQPYTPDGFRIYVRPYVAGDPSVEQSPIEWPGTGLDSAGEPVDMIRGVRCGVVDGPDVSKVIDAAAKANQLTPWTSDGRDFGVVFRPLLPDESGC
jgi:hypothetical protein